MKIRIISGIALIIVFAVLLIAGGSVLLTALLALSVIGIFEYFNAVEYTKTFQPFRITGVVAIFALYVALLLMQGNVWDGRFLFYFVTLVMVVLMVQSIFCYPKQGIGDAAVTLFGVLYVGVLFSYVYLLRIVPGGQLYVWYIFAASWGCDTCAYFSGMFLGRHKLAPVLSPKKTIEGAIGGVIGAVLLCTIYGMIISSIVGIDRGVMLKISLLVGLVGSFVAQVGDIFASSIKRKMKIKDFGRLIPGHGGILDRFDSILMVGPVIVMILDVFGVV